MVEFRDVRIIALGVLSKPRSSFSVNQNARHLLHPPGVTKGADEVAHATSAVVGHISEGSEEGFPITALDPPLSGRTAPGKVTFILASNPSGLTKGGFSDQPQRCVSPLNASTSLSVSRKLSVLHPWRRRQAVAWQRRLGREWPPMGGPYDVCCAPVFHCDDRLTDCYNVAPLHCRLTAQLIGPQTKYFEGEEGRTFLQDIDLVVGPGRNQYASLTWEDLKAIAPWVELTNMINGPGLGH